MLKLMQPMGSEPSAEQREQFRMAFAGREYWILVVPRRPNLDDLFATIAGCVRGIKTHLPNPDVAEVFTTRKHGLCIFYFPKSELLIDGLCDLVGHVSDFEKSRTSETLVESDVVILPLSGDSQEFVDNVYGSLVAFMAECGIDTRGKQ